VAGQGLWSSTGGGVGQSRAALVASRHGLLTPIYPVVTMGAPVVGWRGGVKNARCRKLEKPAAESLITRARGRLRLSCSGGFGEAMYCRCPTDLSWWSYDPALESESAIPFPGSPPDPSSYLGAQRHVRLPNWQWVLPTKHIASGNQKTYYECMFIWESGIHPPNPGSLYGIMKFLVARKEGRKDKPNEEGGYDKRLVDCK